MQSENAYVLVKYRDYYYYVIFLNHNPFFPSHAFVVKGIRRVADS